MKIIGSKDKIAVKIEVLESKSTNGIYGNVLLYLDFQEIGYFNESINIGAFVSQFRKLINGVAELQMLNELSNEDALKAIVESDDESYDGCILSLGESFDDFEVRFFGIDESVRIVWKMVADPYHVYSEGVNTKSGGIVLSKEEIRNVVNLLEKEIES